MRRQIEKLRKGKSTKYERRFMELLKENHIPFKAKVMIGGREVAPKKIKEEYPLKDMPMSSDMQELGYKTFGDTLKK